MNTIDLYGIIIIIMILYYSLVYNRISEDEEGEGDEIIKIEGNEDKESNEDKIE